MDKLKNIVRLKTESKKIKLFESNTLCKLFDF